MRIELTTARRTAVAPRSAHAQLIGARRSGTGKAQRRTSRQGPNPTGDTPCIAAHETNVDLLDIRKMRDQIPIEIQLQGAIGRTGSSDGSTAGEANIVNGCLSTLCKFRYNTRGERWGR